MNEQHHEEYDCETPLLTLLQQIKDGVLNPKLIDKKTRKELVRLLRSEGYLCSHIAQIFDCSEKTIYRDIKVIEAENALEVSPEFAKQLIGEILNTARQHWASLTRIARSAATLPQNKINAEVAAWGVMVTLFEKLQSLGYLPQVPNAVVGDFSHRVSVESKETTFTELKTMLDEIASVSTDSDPLSPEITAEIEQLRGRIQKAELASSIEELKQNIVKTQEDSHE